MLCECILHVQHQTVRSTEDPVTTVTRLVVHIRMLMSRTVSLQMLQPYVTDCRWKCLCDCLITCLLLELRRMQQISIIYFLYLSIFSGLEYTLTFLTHNRFDFSRYVLCVLLFVFVVYFTCICAVEQFLFYAALNA